MTPGDGGVKDKKVTASSHRLRFIAAGRPHALNANCKRRSVASPVASLCRESRIFRRLFRSGPDSIAVWHVMKLNLTPILLTKPLASFLAPAVCVPSPMAIFKKSSWISWKQISKCFHGKMWRYAIRFVLGCMVWFFSMILMFIRLDLKHWW